MIRSCKRMTVIAPHPDDETLGAGATIARLADDGVDVSVLIISGHLPPLYQTEIFELTKREADAALKLLGVSRWDFLRIPATKVNEVPVAEINGRINSFLRETSPDIVLLPFPDRHIDHRIIFDASVVACRPIGTSPPKLVMAYETLSETHWNVPGVEPSFTPEVFIDVGAYIDRKRSALECYASQLNNVPSRSVDACLALSRFRGSQNGCLYAEAFKLIRAVF